MQIKQALLLLNERYVAKVTTCEKQQANQLSNDNDSVSMTSSLSTDSLPTDPSSKVGGKTKQYK